MLRNVEELREIYIYKASLSDEELVLFHEEEMEKIKIEAEAIEIAESRKMNTDYNGKSVSLTSADALALMQIKTAFEMGETRTIFKFKNGEEMELTPTIFAEFAPWFVQKRNEFFQ